MFAGTVSLLIASGLLMQFFQFGMSVVLYTELSPTSAGVVWVFGMETRGKTLEEWLEQYRSECGSEQARSHNG